MKKVFFTCFSILFLLGSLFIFEFNKYNDGKLHVIFCDVGQGDAILIKTPGGRHILIDGGPDRKVLNCLASHMPFWERKIDLMILTHPHADHFMGMYYILERYAVAEFATEQLENESGEFQGLVKELKKKSIPFRYVLAGDKWKLEDNSIVLSVLGPSKEFLQKTSPTGNINDNNEFASLILNLSFHEFNAIFTGDTQKGELSEAASNVKHRIDVLQSPHHGSGTGLDKEIVDYLMPKTAIISVGKYNRYGHPNKTILQLFQEAKIPILRTDALGDIEVIVSENQWHVR